MLKHNSWLGIMHLCTFFQIVCVVLSLVFNFLILCKLSNFNHVFLKMVMSTSAGFTLLTSCISLCNYCGFEFNSVYDIACLFVSGA